MSNKKPENRLDNKYNGGNVIRNFIDAIKRRIIKNCFDDKMDRERRQEAMLRSLELSEEDAEDLLKLEPLKRQLYRYGGEDHVQSVIEAEEK